MRCPCFRHRRSPDFFGARAIRGGHPPFGGPNRPRRQFRVGRHAGDVLDRARRDGKRSERAALDAHERLTEIKIRLLGDRVSRRTAWRIAREQDWDTLRDAEYLAITRLQADALVTVDARMAALAISRVPVAPVDALFAAE